MGRPQIEIDEGLVYDLARLHIPTKDIANVVGCSVTTLNDRFRSIIDKGVSEGKNNLRRLQWKAAESGNVTMLIWLGKQVLGQSDKVQNENMNTDIVLTFGTARPKDKGE
jgi:hypothetical protein